MQSPLSDVLITARMALRNRADRGAGGAAKIQQQRSGALTAARGLQNVRFEYRRQWWIDARNGGEWFHRLGKRYRSSQGGLPGSRIGPTVKPPGPKCIPSRMGACGDLR